MLPDVEVVTKTGGRLVSCPSPPRAFLGFSESVIFLSSESVFTEASGKMEYSNYLLFLCSASAHNMIFQNVGSASKPPPPWEDPGGAFQGFGHAGAWVPVTKTLVPFCSLARSRHSLGLGATIREMRCVTEPPLRFPSALTFFTHAGP